MNKTNTFSTAFLLRTSKAKQGKAPIYCRIAVNGQRSEFSIKLSVELSLWQNGKVKGNGEEARRVRSYLKQLEAKLFEHYRNLIADDTLLDLLLPMSTYTLQNKTGPYIRVIDSEVWIKPYECLPVKYNQEGV